MITKPNRSRVSLEMPRELEILEPILHALGYEWSNHYVMQNAPESCWSLVFTENGKAGPVGMTADQSCPTCKLLKAAGL